MSAFRSAVPLLPHPTTPFTLDVDRVTVSGYLFRPASGANGSAAVVWPVERAATVESSYWQVAVPILTSHTACAVFTTDSARAASSGPARPDPDRVVGAVVELLRSRHGVEQFIESPGGIDPARAVLPARQYSCGRAASSAHRRN